jgi:hypothetical protein
MVFSYGFIESGVTDARQLFLDLDIPDDDPLKPAKKMVCDDAPGVRLFSLPPSEFESAAKRTGWESPFVWWACVNEEDGLDFRVLQSNDGDRELKVFWKEKELQSSDRLPDLLKADPMWDVFLLRATLIVLDRVETQLSLLQESQDIIERREGLPVAASVRDTAMTLRKLEGEFYVQAMQDLEAKVRPGYNRHGERRLQLTRPEHDRKPSCSSLPM